MEARKLLRRMLLASQITGSINPGDAAAPAASATETLWDSMADDAANGRTALARPGRALTYRRLLLSVYASHTLNIIVDWSIDGTNYDFSDTYVYAATAQTVYTIRPFAPHARVRVQEAAAATLTSCRIALVGDAYDAEGG